MSPHLRQTAAAKLVRPALLAVALLAGACASGGEEVVGPGSDRPPIVLPTPDTVGRVTLEASLRSRRSVRDFTADELNLSQVGQLLWAAQGVTAAWGGRTAPSAGATYPLEVQVAVSRVEGLAPGVYRYRPDTHALVPGVDRPVGDQLADACVGQRWVAAAPVQIVVATVEARTAARYGERAGRYVLLEAGHAAQNLLLEATALHLGAATVGAFDDDRVASVVGLGPGEAPVYVVPVGYPGTAADPSG